jgi:polyisoprenoid-binding protein YceI
MSSEKYGRVAKGSRTTGIQRTFPPSLLLFLLAAYLAGIPVRAAAEYSLNQNFGSIAFSVSHLGLFSSQGEFRRFDAKLDFDDMHPERTHIVVDVDAASVDMPWQEGALTLRSVDFFDVLRYPEIRFMSTSVTPEGPGLYAVRGLLQMRGITRPLVLHARLVGRHADLVRRRDIAEFEATGMLQRSAFGMKAQEAFISDTVHITIRARIALEETSSAG